MDEYDYSDFDWYMYPEHVYDIDFRQKMVRELKIEKDNAVEFFWRVEDAASSAANMRPILGDFPTDKNIKDAWVSVSSKAAKLLDEIQNADEVIEPAFPK